MKCHQSNVKILLVNYLDVKGPQTLKRKCKNLPWVKPADLLDDALDKLWRGEKEGQERRKD